MHNKELAIGTATGMLLIEAEFDGRAELERRFLTNVRLFYEATMKKIIMKFPFHGQVLGDLQLLNLKARPQVSQVSVIRFAKRFTAMEPDQVDVVLSELRDFKTIPDSQLPTSDSSESFWHLVGKMAIPGDTSRLRFKNLTDLIKTLLLLPHGNADSERLFSMVGATREPSPSYCARCHQREDECVEWHPMLPGRRQTVYSATHQGGENRYNEKPQERH